LFFRKKILFDKNNLQSVIYACKLEDSKAQKELVEQYYGYAMSVCKLYSQSTEETEEMINDGFLKVFNNINKYESEKSFKAWFRTLLVHTCIDYYRKYHIHQNIISLEQAYDVSIESEVLDSFNADQIQSLISQLPEACRIVFTLFVIEGYSHKEIAEQLSIQEGTSKSHLRDARIKLKKKILMQVDTEIMHDHTTKTQP
jgi:RNA polymerase sigma-70 factor, ECF subfamily